MPVCLFAGDLDELGLAMSRLHADLISTVTGISTKLNTFVYPRDKVR